MTRGSDSSFDDLLAANERFAQSRAPEERSGRARRGLAVVTCVDSRIDPLAMLGLIAGDAKILRNAGARVSDDVLRSLVLVTNLLGVHRIMIVAHTDCALTGRTDDDVRRAITASCGIDVVGFEPHTAPDRDAVLDEDIERIRSNPFMPAEVTVAGFVYDVVTGRLTPR